MQRLYDTQLVYDRKLEVCKYLAAQNEVRFNKDKPSINEKSENLLYESNNWKPLHLRTGEVIQKANQQLEKLKERVNEERMKKELEQQKIIEQNRVDRHTKGKKVKAEDWEELYNQRFKKYLEVKNK